MEGAVHATLFIDVLAVGLVVPLLPFKADELRLSSLSFGLLTSLYGVAQLIGGIIVGVLADRFLGRKLALMISLLVSACGYLLLMSTSTVRMFALSRIVNASAPSMALARLGAVTALAWTCGTGLSGLLASTPYGHLAPVTTAVSLLIFGAAFAAWAVKETPIRRASGATPAQGRIANLLSDVSELWHRRGRMGFILVVKALFAFAALTSQSGYAKDRFRLSPSGHGYMMAYSGLVAFVTQSVLMPTLNRRLPNLNERLAMLVAATLVASVTLVQCFTRPSTNVYMFLLLPTSLAASSFLNVHLIAAYLRQVPSTDASLALSVAGALDALARAAVPAISGMLKQWVGLRGPPLGDALLLISLVAVLWLEPPASRTLADSEKRDGDTHRTIRVPESVEPFELDATTQLPHSQIMATQCTPSVL